MIPDEPDYQSVGPLLRRFLAESGASASPDLRMNCTGWPDAASANPAKGPIGTTASQGPPQSVGHGGEGKEKIRSEGAREGAFI